MGKIFSKIRRPSLRQGVIFGLILGVILIIDDFVSGYLPPNQLLVMIPLALFIVFGFLAGQRAVQETGKVGTGALASFWASLFGRLLEVLAEFILVLVYLPSLVAQARLYIQQHPKDYPGVNPTTFSAGDYLMGFLISLLVSLPSFLLLYALSAVIGGLVGGMLGRRNAVVLDASDEYQDAPLESEPAEGTAQVVEATKTEVSEEL